jgi:hypothetical protein
VSTQHNGAPHPALAMATTTDDATFAPLSPEPSPEFKEAQGRILANVLASLRVPAAQFASVSARKAPDVGASEMKTAIGCQRSGENDRSPNPNRLRRDMAVRIARSSFGNCEVSETRSETREA